MASDQPLKLFIFAVQSYGAMASFDAGDTDEDFDGNEVIVGHQYAANLDDAKKEMALELADNLYEKPDFYTDDAEAYEKLNGGQMKEVDEYDDKLEKITNELTFYELVPGGQHSTHFMN